MNIASIGIDLGKTTFHLVALGERNKILLRRKFSRSQLLAYTANLPASKQNKPDALLNGFILAGPMASTVPSPLLTQCASEIIAWTIPHCITLPLQVLARPANGPQEQFWFEHQSPSGRAHRL
jgi:hypothetical protein